MKTPGKLILAKYLPVILGALWILPLASAQTGFQGKFTLQEQVRWGLATLPPGEYTVTLASLRMPNYAVLRSVDRKRTLLVCAGVRGDFRSGDSNLVIAGVGARRHVTSLNLGEIGVSLIYESEAERYLGKEASLTKSEIHLNVAQR